MAGLTAHGATFTFLQFRGAVTGVSIETPVAELADMTDITAPASHMVMVPTGAWSGGSVTVDFLAGPNHSPGSLVRQVGILLFASQNFTFAVNAVCESASVAAQAGDLVKGSMRFRPTDYYVS